MSESDVAQRFQKEGNFVTDETWRWTQGTLVRRFARENRIWSRSTISTARRHHSELEMSTIARIWRGQAAHDKADAYYHHVTETVFPGLTALRGHIGAYLLRRQTNEGVEFLAVTLWESLEAVKQFAGDEPDVAVVEPAARAVLTAFDPFVRHYEVVHSADCERS
jgi:heme-degrading monooxygenase HmoA